jgi:uncharacterized repeat protein (TIGR03803 family)
VTPNSLKTIKTISSLLLMLMGLTLTSGLKAQNFTNIYTFTGGTDGNTPLGGVVKSGNTLYGTTELGGANGVGAVFSVNTDGTGFTVMHSFTVGGNNDTNLDGYYPYAGLVLSGTTLYGTTRQGGAHGIGTIFALVVNDTSATAFTTLYNFSAENGLGGVLTNSDGANPTAGLILSGNSLNGTLYGTAEQGGTNGIGTVFAFNLLLNGLTTVHNFSPYHYDPASSEDINNDGLDPQAGLILSNNILYGTTPAGGAYGNGTVFAVNIDGGGFTVLHNFTAFGSGETNSDGAASKAGLVLSGATLYGTAAGGGNAGSGTVFAVNINTLAFTNLHSFSAYPSPDGADPVAGLVLSSNILYGTTGDGGSEHAGTVYALNLNDNSFTTLYNFGSGSDGGFPGAGLILSSNTLYGTTELDGVVHDESGDGTVFGLSLGPVTVGPPQLIILLSGTNVLLGWPLAATGYTLQSTTNLVSPAAWSTVSPSPVPLGTYNVVTNTLSGTQKFYRLSQ